MVVGKQIPDWSSTLQAELVLHVAFGKRELIPAGKAEVDSLSWFAQANDCFPHLLLGTAPRTEDLVQTLNWPLGGIRDTTKAAEQLYYEFMMVDISLQAAIPEEGKLIHQLHSEGRLEKALNKYKLESCPNNDIWWQGISYWTASLVEFQLKLLQSHS